MATALFLSTFLSLIGVVASARLLIPALSLAYIRLPAAQHSGARGTRFDAHTVGHR